MCLDWQTYDKIYSSWPSQDVDVHHTQIVNFIIDNDSYPIGTPTALKQALVML